MKRWHLRRRSKGRPLDPTHSYILFTEQFEVISLWRDTQPVLVQNVQLVDGVDVGPNALDYLVGDHGQFLYPAEKNKRAG